MSTEHDRFNALLRECEVELAKANLELSNLMESDDFDPDDPYYITETDILMDQINKLVKEYESLLQTL